ncbi:hypothetical protein GOBAR_DD34718 [Gossypium barbadense]|nr:hypothetical protein GOBAR_DD34718 [Gossypium barbadense]
MPPSTSLSAFPVAKEVSDRCYVAQPQRPGRKRRAISRLAKKAKNGKKGVGDGEAEKYVAKYREQSARCVAVVEESVKAACLGKRKAVPGGADPKRLKIWMGKRKLNESDSDNSSDDEESEDDEEDEKSVVLNNGNNSDSSKGTEGSSGLVSRRRRDGEFSGGVSSESGSEEEKDIVPLQSSKSGGEDVLNVENDKVEVEAIQPEILENNGTKTEDQKEIVSQGADVPVQENEGVGNKLIDRVDGCSDVKSEFHGETVVSNTNVAIPEKPLNFDDFNSPQEMEVLGLERLKSELQARGLKCGGLVCGVAPSAVGDFRHTGHVEFIRSHSSIHSAWKQCLHSGMHLIVSLLRLRQHCRRSVVPLHGAFPSMIATAEAACEEGDPGCARKCRCSN